MKWAAKEIKRWLNSQRRLDAQEVTPEDSAPGSSFQTEPYLGEVFSADSLFCRGVIETTRYSRSLSSKSSARSNILSL